MQNIYKKKSHFDLDFKYLKHFVESYKENKKLADLWLLLSVYRHILQNRCERDPVPSVHISININGRSSTHIQTIKHGYVFDLILLQKV